MHARSQAPQCVTLSVRFTQLDPHNVVPAPHTAPQRPDEHTRPLAQALPHVPQFDPSERRSVQPLAQRTRPDMHAPEPPAPPPEAPPPAPGREVCPQLAAIRPRKVPANTQRHARLGGEFFCMVAIGPPRSGSASREASAPRPRTKRDELTDASETRRQTGGAGSNRRKGEYRSLGLTAQKSSRRRKSLGERSPLPHPSSSNQKLQGMG